MKKGFFENLFRKWIKKDELRFADFRLKKIYDNCEDEEEKKQLLAVRKYIKKYRNRQFLHFKIIAIGLAAILVLAVAGVSFSIANSMKSPSANVEKTEDKIETESAKEEVNTETEETKLLANGKEPLEKDLTELTFTFTGDFITGTDENFAYDTSFNAYYDNYGGDYFLENVRSIFEKDDATVINMECTLTNETSRNGNQFAFKGDPEYISVLNGSSIEAANTANNHSFDYGEKSYTDTVELLESNHIKTFGYDSVAILDLKGVQVGIYGIYELDDHLERIPQLKQNIQKLKDAKVDIIIGVFHWSNELVTYPDENQFTLAELAIDEGTDLIVGHHPHIIQGIGTYNGKTIAYSLGNFCFGGNTNPTEMDTIIYQHKFTLNKEREIVAEDRNVIPCLVSSVDWINNYQPTPETGEAAQWTLDKLAQRSEGLNPPEYTTLTEGIQSSDNPKTVENAEERTVVPEETEASSDGAEWEETAGEDDL